MSAATVSLDSNALRAQLMERSPMERARALHALETQAVSGGPLANEASRFVARGMPYYQPNDPHYQSWVRKAVHYWELLQR